MTENYNISYSTGGSYPASFEELPQVAARVEEGYTIKTMNVATLPELSRGKSTISVTVEYNAPTP